MAGATVLICSKLPNGLIIRNPLQPSVSLTINGLNSAPKGHDKKPIYVQYMTTVVPKDFWDAWLAVHDHATKPFGPLKSGAIFEAKNEDHAKGIAKEQSKRLTGLQPMAQTADDRMGADKNKLKPREEKD